MPSFNMYKNGELVNTIVADSVEPTGEYWDHAEEVIPPPPPPPPPLPPRTWSQNDVRSKMTFTEKTKWDNGLTPEMVTAKVEFETPKELQETTDILDFLVETNNILEQTKTNILA
jgi:hypothetical protein